jgi:hypothetical protein
MPNQNNGHATQMNSNQLKRHLLLWLIGLSFFNISMLIVVLLLIIFAPALLQHCAVRKSKSHVQRRHCCLLFTPNSLSNIDKSIEF